jgi:pSer/pThr/pTyr-binding forkhead associated (FHA) protein
VHLAEPRVSGVHATLKFETSQLWVKDETSNNGTFVDNLRVPAGQWIPVPAGGHLRFGPVEFSVRVDT